MAQCPNCGEDANAGDNTCRYCKKTINWPAQDTAAEGTAAEGTATGRVIYGALDPRGFFFWLVIAYIGYKIYQYNTAP